VRPQSSYINPIQRQAAPHTVHTSRRMSTSAPHRSFAPPRHASPHTRLSGVRPSPHANVIILSGSLLQIKLNSFRHSPYISIITNVITNASSSASSRDSSRPHCGAHHTRVTRACESSSRRPSCSSKMASAAVSAALLVLPSCGPCSGHRARFVLHPVN
jgi:hypothetical protein